MKIELSEEQINRQKEFKAYVDNELISYADVNDEQEFLDPQCIKTLASKGYLGSMISKKYGGMGMDNITIGILNEEIGRACSSTRSLLTVHGMVALAVNRWGTDEQKSYWLPKMAQGEIIGAFGLTEPDIGCDAKNIGTTAIHKEDCYIISGKKKWTTMGQVADLFLIFAQHYGKPTAFLVERNCPGLSIQPIHGLLGARASMIALLHLEDCRIPEKNLVGGVGTGLTHVAQSSLDYGRYTIACGCVGLAQACLEECIRYARKRKQFGVPLRQHQLIQKMITEMVVNIEAARLLCHKAGYMKDLGEPDSIIQTWIAKYFASTIVGKVSSDAVQIHGANGCSSQYPVERYFRDAKINEIIEGTTQMHELLISTNAFRSH